MRILVTGINGQVGWELRRQGGNLGVDILGVDHAALDISDRQGVLAAVVSHRPNLVINAAAYTAVDRAEEQEAKAYAVNCDGPAWLAAACSQVKIPLMHISTDYVFDGTAQQPYSEEDAVSPLGVYGRSKEAGEREVRSRLDEHLIIRTSWVYGVHGQNFVKTMLRLGKNHHELKVVADQWGCPTAAADLAAALLKLARQIKAGTKRWGTYHCCGATATTWHGFAEAIFARCRGRIALQVEKVNAISTAEYPTPAKRPSYSVLACQKLAQDFQIRLPELSISLTTVINELALLEQSGP
ncbi:MAG: dTDP-4-dehydrorhamnose reductase [Proteobacteria bacterium]|nr:dTDP-4-dehydrorhamnose reductase [Pseudomonadota bacterium]MBU1641570.1 dTDP-4-dehydrorhamnose reductase [Pseudomonadota bacterium]